MLDVKKEYLQELREIFNEYCPKAEIWAYGSRIKNNSHSGSDLDLAVKSFNDKTKSVGELRELLNDSDIPFLIDISEFDRLPESFQDEILKGYVRVFPAQNNHRFSYFIQDSEVYTDD
ncbi:MAG: nucleotidyltransferase domain-containing protein [Clostridiales bacterium]|nr:nucleotidyltransferase domain-containing protein [Clostridiales bacterium]